jgi:hypothetical protein
MKVRRVQTNFTGGEIGELLEGRSNMQIYEDGASKIRNFRIMPQGGLTRRPGTTYCATLQNIAYQHEEYAFNSTQTYQLIFSNARLDIHSGVTGALIQTISTLAWTAAMIGKLSVHPAGDYIFVCHPDLPIQQITRTGASTFTVAAYAFEKQLAGASAPVYQPYYKYAAADLTMRAVFIAYSGGGGWSAATGWRPGSTATIYASAAFFSASYVGLYLKIGTGQFEITSYTSTTQVSATLRSIDFRHQLPSQPMTLITGSTTVEVLQPYHGLTGGSVVTLTGGEGFRNLPSTDVNGAVSVIATTTNTWSYTAATAADRSAIGGGLSVYTWGADTTTAEWAEPLYSAVRGWPHAVTGHQNRIVFGGGTNSPNRLSLSKVEAPWNFDVGTGLDDESIQLSISFKRVPVIHYLVSDKHLQIFTSEGEFYAPFGIGFKPLTPASVSVIPQSQYGTAMGLPPVPFDGATLFLTKTGKSLRELVFGNNDVGYSAPNISFQASHLLVSPQRMASLMEDDEQQEAVSYIVNGDGTLATFSFVRKESIAAWGLWTTTGLYKTACAVDRRMFFIVERTVNGVTKTFLEKMDHDALLDCSVTVTGAAATTWAGFSHLASQEVAVVVNETGSIGPKTVTAGGSVVLDENATSVQAGFNFTPYGKTLPPEISLPDGPTLGQPRRVTRVILQTSESVSARVDGSIYAVTRAEDDISLAPTPRSVNIELYRLGWDKKGQIEFEAPDPAPFTLLGLLKDIEF